VVKKISLAVVLLAMAGVASADASGCLQFAFLSRFCQAGPNPGTVSAPEIDPASAMAGLTMLAGGLAVLRGRRKKISVE
jgi:LPXTG-motif cell wall-anchored protein